jgi:hypothetical protein
MLKAIAVYAVVLKKFSFHCSPVWLKTGLPIAEIITFFPMVEANRAAALILKCG